MSIHKLDRKNNKLLFKGEELRWKPLCPVINFSSPARNRRDLEADVQREAEIRAGEVLDKPTRVYYDADALKVGSSTADNSWVYVTALQLYTERNREE